jgi:hypothetical protein
MQHRSRYRISTNNGIDSIIMDKKDLIFLATTLVVSKRFTEFKPYEEIEKNKDSQEFFIAWFKYLSALYEEC